MLLSRKFVTLGGLILAKVLIAFPVSDSFGLLADFNYVFWSGPSLPITIIASLIGMLVVYILVSGSMGGRDTPYYTLHDLATLVSFFLSALGVILALAALFLIHKETPVSTSLLYSCNGGALSRQVSNAYFNLLTLRQSPACVNKFSVSECEGFGAAAPRKYARYLKELEENYHCSGFCYSDAAFSAANHNATSKAASGKSAVNKSIGMNKGHAPQAKAVNVSVGKVRQHEAASEAANASLNKTDPGSHPKAALVPANNSLPEPALPAGNRSVSKAAPLAADNGSMPAPAKDLIEEAVTQEVSLSSSSQSSQGLGTDAQVFCQTSVLLAKISQISINATEQETNATSLANATKQETNATSTANATKQETNATSIANATKGSGNGSSIAKVHPAPTAAHAVVVLPPLLFSRYKHKSSCDGAAARSLNSLALGTAKIWWWNAVCLFGLSALVVAAQWCLVWGQEQWCLVVAAVVVAAVVVAAVVLQHSGVLSLQQLYGDK
jgi:hypothetical protein